MKKGLTPLQVDIIKLVQTRDLSKMSLRQIGGVLGDEHPYAVQLAIKALLRDGRLIENKRTGSLTLPLSQVSASRLINIPVLGRVSCGIATELAQDGPREFVAVSPSLIATKRMDNIFALIAAGDSMNRANINSKGVDDGDYVVVHKAEWNVADEGDYVVSRIDGAYNLKRLHIDASGQRIVLMSESTEPYPPIFIAEEDIGYYAIEGIAVDVIKGVGI